MANRLDSEIFSRGLAKSREQAKNLILSGNVFVNEKEVLKPSLKITEDDIIEIRGEIMPYVSRGGLKLEKAVGIFKINLDGKTAIDMGASTGGFSDCMLQNGAEKIYAVDVGTGQLAEKIKNDPRVINMENTNIRNITKAHIPDKIDFISIDTSFISLKLILPVAFDLLDPDGEIVALIKPQFEAGRGNIGKNGIVKDKKVHKSVITEIYNFVQGCGFTPAGLTVSPISGGDGNIEYLMYINKNRNMFETDYIERVVFD